MARCLSLFGLMFFTMGVVALASVAGTPASSLPVAPPQPSEDEENSARPPRRLSFPALTYPAQFSVN
jgi:hypothetical protein